VLGKAASLLLREHELPVDEHVELPLVTGDDRRLRSRIRRDLGRETRGPSVITVSDGAVVDLDAHAATLSRARLGSAEAPTYTRLV
jgi:hypothetical protein